MNTDIFSKNLKELRAQNGLTQDFLGKKLDKTQSQISQLENAIIEPSLSDLIRIADIFEVSTDFLLGREGEFGVPVNIENRYNEVMSIFDRLNISEQDKSIGYMQSLLDNRGKSGK